MQTKFKAHQTFFIRKGWLSKGLFAVDERNDIFMPSNSKEAMDQLGLGANQVVALRYWLKTVGLIDDVTKPKRAHRVTDLGKLVIEKDPYMEEAGTLWALHCELCSEKTEATSWYWLFNELKATSFSKDDFVRGIQKFILQNSDENDAAKTPATSSLESDFECIVNTYIPHDRLGGKKVSPENVIDCPLGELGILGIDSKRQRTYRKKPASSVMLPDLLVLYSIRNMVKRLEEDKEGWFSPEEIPLEQLLSGRYSPGMTFNLDSIGLLDKLYELENAGMLRINRTAGSDVVRLEDTAAEKLECLKLYYEMIG